MTFTRVNVFDMGNILSCVYVHVSDVHHMFILSLAALYVALYFAMLVALLLHPTLHYGLH